LILFVLQVAHFLSVVQVFLAAPTFWSVIMLGSTIFIDSLLICRSWQLLIILHQVLSRSSSLTWIIILMRLLLTLRQFHLTLGGFSVWLIVAHLCCMLCKSSIVLASRALDFVCTFTTASVIFRIPSYLFAPIIIVTVVTLAKLSWNLKARFWVLNYATLNIIKFGWITPRQNFPIYFSIYFLYMLDYSCRLACFHFNCGARSIFMPW
jgi:hypothetical protein